MSSFARKVKSKFTNSDNTSDDNGSKSSRPSSLRRSLSLNRRKDKEARTSVEVKTRKLNASKDSLPEEAKSTNGAEAVSDTGETVQNEEPNAQEATSTEQPEQPEASINPEVPTETPQLEVNEGAIEAIETPEPGGEANEAEDGLSGNLPSNLNPQFIKASSTPIQQNESSARDAILESEDASEYTPLLRTNFSDIESGPEERYTRRCGQTFYDYLFGRNAWKTVTILILVILVVASLYFTSKNIEALINQAVKPDVQSVSILDISETGVSFSVIGSVYVEYEFIENYVYRYVLKVAGLLIGGVTITATTPSQVLIGGELIPKVHAVDFLPPELSVDLIDRRLTEIDFIGEATFVEGEVERLAGSVLRLIRENTDEALLFDVEVVMESKVESKWFSYDIAPLHILRDVMVSREDMELPVDIDQIYANVGDESVDIDVSLSSKPLPVSLSFSALQWDLSLADCNGDPSFLGIWESESFAIIPGKSSNCEVHGEVTKISKDLLDACPEDGLSPFNRFTNLLFENNTVHVLVSASKSSSNEKALPTWLYEILTENTIELYTPIPPVPNGEFERIMRNFTIVAFGLEIPSPKVNHVNHDGFQMKLEAKTSLNLDLPFNTSGLNLKVFDVDSQLVLLDLPQDLLLATTWGDVNIEVTDVHPGEVTGTMGNVTVDVIDANGMAQRVNKFINNSTIDIPEWILNVELAHVQLPLVSTTLKGLQLHYPSHSVKKEDFTTALSNLDWLVSNLNALIDQLFYKDSSPSHISFVVDFQVSNPLQASFKIPGDTLTFDYTYNDTSVGELKFTDLVIPRTNDRVNLTATLSIHYTSETQKILVEDFLSHVISAAEDLHIGLSGTENSSLNNPGLGRLLRTLHIDSIRVPEIDFSHDDEDGGVHFTEEKAPRRSPFLVGATIHILKSEIELTVYNPMANAEIMAEILDCQASYKGEPLARIERTELLIVPPGLYTTPRIPLQVAQGLGADILRKALNGDLAVDVIGELSIRIDKFQSDLLYRGAGLTAKVTF